MSTPEDKGMKDDKARFKVYTAKDILNLPPRTDEHEAEYRRGYRDGFILAVEDMYSHMEHRHAARATFREVYDKFWDFWQDVLHEWQHKDVSNHNYFPPRPRVKP